MPHPGREKDYDYSDVPYKVNWTPAPGREWALQYCRSLPGEQDDQQGFERELRVRIPHIFQGHSVPSWIPDVDYFVRHDPKGCRMDINADLARMPKPEEVVEAQRKEREERVKREWQESLEAHEEANATAPDPELVQMGRETGGEGGRNTAEMKRRMTSKARQAQE